MPDRIIKRLNPFQGIQEWHMGALVNIAYGLTLTNQPASAVVTQINNTIPALATLLALWCGLGAWYLMARHNISAMALWFAIMPQTIYFGFTLTYWMRNAESQSIVGVSTHGLVFIMCLYLINKRLEAIANGHPTDS